jgi:hypothetical protein
MYYLDTKLGGTIPFDVVVRFPPYEDLSFGADDELEEDIFATEEEDEWEGIILYGPGGLRPGVY